MKMNVRYEGQSAIVNGLDQSYVALATNTLREAAFFKGEIKKARDLREGLAALHSVVVSDFKYKPKDRLAFRLWLEEQDRLFLQQLSAGSPKIQARIEELEGRKHVLNGHRQQRLRPFHAARARYFDYVYTNEYELNYLLDPVITVHPDEIFFEAFSKDESTYGRFSVPYTHFKKVDEFECGTTNIDFSSRLHNELDRMRSYRQTRLDIEPSGFTVATAGPGGKVHKEKKIDLPESWVQGFLQVHSVMSMSLTRLTLKAVDLYNICRFLKRHKAKKSPRALRFECQPGQPVRAVFEPWDKVIELSYIYEGSKPKSIRTWGRDRLKLCERLLPVTKSIELGLAGTGLPSVYVFDMGGPKFTMALSGWTDNDWTGGARFSLLTRRAETTAENLMTVYEIIKRRRRSSDSALAAEAAIKVEEARAALSYLCQAGRAIYDLGAEAFRHRDLFMAPFTEKEAQQAVKAKVAESTPQEKRGRAIFEAGQIRITARRPLSSGFKLTGSCKADSGRVRPLLHSDKEGRIIEASCTCKYFKKHKLTKGPCEHILALRLAHIERLEREQ